ncbi:TPA: hypothetical protein ACJEWJ_005223, partial [Klebsiella quasipneumoniae]
MHLRTPGKRNAAGQALITFQATLLRRFFAGWRLRLTRSTGFVRPVVHLFTSPAETAGADGLKIAETFPEGRGSPHVQAHASAAPP